MPLYKLHAKQPDHPPFHKYDTTHEIVVRAPSEEDARKFVSTHPRGSEAPYGNEGPEVWADPKLTWCDRIITRGKTEVVCRDFKAA